jgi:hypothetical protein
MAMPYAMASHGMFCSSHIGPMQPANEVCCESHPGRRAGIRGNRTECIVILASSLL